MSDKTRWNDIGSLIAELFTPFYDVNGTKHREFELKKLARKLRESTKKSGQTNFIYQRNLVKKMHKITNDQIAAVADAKHTLPIEGDIC